MSSPENQKTHEEDEKEDSINKNEDEEKQAKLIEAMNDLPTNSMKSKAVLLYDLNEDMKSQYFGNYKDEKVSIELKENSNFLNYLNKIRDIVSTSLNINSTLDPDDVNNYNLVMNDEKEFTPIKNFWSTALINATFFEINDKDKKILEYFKDICFIPLDYPSFKIEFRFEPNEYMKETTLIKTFYFVENEKNELKNVEGCKINWLDDEKNPTIKLTTRKKKKGKSREIITTSKKVDSFFNIFDTKDADLRKELIEAQFFRNDFLQNMLEYYLNIMEIRYDKNDEEDSEEEEIEK